MSAPVAVLRRSKVARFTQFRRPEIQWLTADDGCGQLFNAEQMQHHLRHHDMYCQQLNEWVRGTKYESQTLWGIMAGTAFDGHHAAIHNAASAHFNHSFLWRCILPYGVEPPAQLLKAIEKDFVSFAKLIEAIFRECLTLQGYGWVWLVFDPTAQRMRVISTAGSNNPVPLNFVPLYAIDLWEHAHMLQYGLSRSEYVRNCLANVNWDFVEECLLRTIDNQLTDHFSVGRPSTYNQLPGHRELHADQYLPTQRDTLSPENVANKLPLVLPTSSDTTSDPSRAPMLQDQNMYPGAYKLEPGSIVAPLSDEL